MHRKFQLKVSRSLNKTSKCYKIEKKKQLVEKLNGFNCYFLCVFAVRMTTKLHSHKLKHELEFESWKSSYQLKDFLYNITNDSSRLSQKKNQSMSFHVFN